MDLDDQFTVFYSTVYKARAEGKKCHAKTMMSIKPDRAQNKHPWSMCRQNLEGKEPGKGLKVLSDV